MEGMNGGSMKPQELTFSPGGVIARQGSDTAIAFLILEGRVQLEVSQGGRTVPRGFAGPGEFLYLDSLLQGGTKPFSAHAVTTVRALGITGAQLQLLFSSLPDWFAEWLREEFRTIFACKANSDLHLLYGVSSLLYILMRAVNTGNGVEPWSAPYGRLVEEIRKTLHEAHGFLPTILGGLSHVGLIDLREAEPPRVSLILPDPELFRAFLVLMQNDANLPSGLYDNNQAMESQEIKQETGLLVDGLLVRPDLLPKLVNPEKSQVHLTYDALTRAYNQQGGEGALDPFHPAIEELEDLGALNRVRDTQTDSVFLNLRELLRLNLRRDPEANLSDIEEFLLERIALDRAGKPTVEADSGRVGIYDNPSL
ncbi:MAG TPA: Crp/Fnr family transcriptional regulator [Bacteroidetes bacterium]|nr:Crp/Fnr family transcriptional regulator [Bacteroidota bacterium]